MKLFLGTLVFLAFTNTASAENLGKKVKVYSDDSGPRFGVLYAYDSDKIWNLTVSLWGPEILPDLNLTKLSWRLYDTASGQFISDWTTAMDRTSPIMYPGTLAFGGQLSTEGEILTGIRALPTLKLVLSVNHTRAPSATHFIDLGEYCNSHPANFANLSSGTSGCANEF